MSLRRLSAAATRASHQHHGLPRYFTARTSTSSFTSLFCKPNVFFSVGARNLLRGLAMTAAGTALYLKAMPCDDHASFSVASPAAHCLSPSPSSVAHPPFDYKAVKADLEALFDNDMSLAPAVVRLAWHGAGAWDKAKRDGGSNTASMRFPTEGGYGANNGLGKVRDALEPIKKKHKGISYADLWVLGAYTAIAVMGGPTIPFKWGRVDAVDERNASPPGRLPDAAQTQDHIRCVFGRMGFDDEEAVALIGAHAMGECHREYSGYVGPWTFDKYGFGNHFYTTLLENEWVLNTREPVLQFTDYATRQLLMLPGDVALLIDPKMRGYVEKFAKDPQLWERKFVAAFTKMMEFNTTNLKPIQ